jgi:hypothetical protein
MDEMDLGINRGMVGPRAQLLVLGTVHLNAMPASFNPAALDGVLDRLAAFRPDIITIEAESDAGAAAAPRRVVHGGERARLGLWAVAAAARGPEVRRRQLEPLARGGAGKVAKRNDESWQIAARLAARLGLPRLHASTIIPATISMCGTSRHSCGRSKRLGPRAVRR